MATSTSDLNAPLAMKVRKQLEFYFSDSNYPRDKFLRAKAAENDGYVPISVIATFSRMQQLSKDEAYLAAIAKKSVDLVVNEEGTMIKRRKPLPEKETTGFPALGSGVTIDSVSEFFTKNGTGGEVLSTRLLRNKENKEFKHCAYVEFATEELAKKVADLKELAWGKNEKGEDIVLKLSQKADNVKEKNEKREQLKKMRKEEKEREEKEAEEKLKKEREYAPGRILELKNLTGSQDSRVLKVQFGKFGRVRYVDLLGLQDNGTAYLRFTDTAHAQAALAAIKDGSEKIEDKVLQGRILEGEEDKKYWADNVTPNVGKAPPAKKPRWSKQKRKPRQKDEDEDDDDEEKADGDEKGDE